MKRTIIKCYKNSLKNEKKHTITNIRFIAYNSY